jgi:hypothetical protein
MISALDRSADPAKRDARKLDARKLDARARGLTQCAWEWEI